ncbi:TonB-dependent siderophore receptor [Shewanella pneumatophori]|uniref:TonB-dependent receptor n=1 Tax=Shewanella pneumatophori TaxID=314092 RepID=A0A9X1ZCB3_9GAMM|nr:TonB-dependent receptor [Shewanella pneumatophori]MCL1137670.1 TonB-dependent receptor [Shewanella pneumatophori]
MPLPKANKQHLLHSALVSSLLISAPTFATEQAPVSEKAAANDNIERIKVHGQRANKMNRQDQTVTKMDVDLKDVGRSVTILDAKDLELRAIEDVKQAFNYVAGFRGNGPADRTYNARGVSTKIDTVMVDGMRSLQGGEGGTGSRLPTTFNAESVTFLRGPEALLYGAGVGGGIINIITKKPQEFNETTIGVRNKSYLSDDTGYFERNDTSFNLDTTGAIADNSDYLYRLLAKYTPSGDHFQERREQTETLADLAFTWVASDNTRITPRFEYADRQLTGGSGYADGVFTSNYFSGDLSEYGEPMNRGQYYGSEKDNGDNNSQSFSLKVDHAFSSEWALAGQYRYNKTKSNALDLYISDSSGLDNEIGDEFIDRKWVYSAGNDSYHLFDISLQGRSQLFGMEHHVLLGYNYRDMKVNFARNFQKNDDALGKNIISVANPENQLVGEIPSSLFDVNARDKNQTDTNIYFKDRIKLTDSTTFVAGLGYIAQEQTEERGGETYNKKYDDMIWDLGVVQAITKDINLFATMSRAYEPVSARYISQYGIDGTEYLPVEGFNYEVGAKADLLNGDFTAALTLFSLERENSTEFVRVDDQWQLLQNTGKSFESQGVEIDSTYFLNDHYDVTLSYAYTDAHNTIGEFKDVQVNNTPKHAAALWNNFNVNDMLSFSLGIRYESDKTDGNDRQFTLPSYVEFDVGAYYTLDKWRFAMVLNNALDKNRVEAGANWVTVQPNTPRALNLSVNYTF